MSDPFNSAARLRRISACIREGLPIDPEDAVPLGEAIDTYLAGSVQSLDAALGLSAPGRGKPDARALLRVAERDEAIRDLAELLQGYAGSGADAERVWNVFEALEKFAEWRWPELRLATTCPDHLVGGADGHMWVILKACGGRVLSRRYLAEIICG